MTRGELERGSRLGKYEIHGRLSVGGMAELYLASLSGAGGFRKFVALKRVLPSISENEDFLRMFLDEARITASLSHSAIAQVFELAEDPQTKEPILVMEFVAGQNLEQLSVRAKARKVTLPVGFTARVAYEVLMGLHSAHGFVEPATGKPMPVIHRDINPRNVMVTYTGGTKIIDFGIAKARGRLNQTQAGFVKGTLQYMAPEQVTAKDVDGRTDLFSASVLFYELFTGKRLFDEGSDAVIMQRVVRGEIPHLAREAPDLDDELADVIMKGLERDPARRWKNGR
ncbi:MAG TPA: serine/threonine-protein kinase, partial [Archangium sp.]